MAKNLVIVESLQARNDRGEDFQVSQDGILPTASPEYRVMSMVLNPNMKYLLMR
jgi:hypothetical protein